MSDAERDRAQEARAGGRALLLFWRWAKGGVMFLPAPAGGDFDTVLARDARQSRAQRDRFSAVFATGIYQ